MNDHKKEELKYSLKKRKCGYKQTEKKNYNVVLYKKR